MSTSDASDTTPSHGPSDLDRVAALIRTGDGLFPAAVANLLADIADDHRRGMCGACQYGELCLMSVDAERVAFAWLLDRVQAS